jgi:hypothetical protein
MALTYEEFLRNEEEKRTRRGLLGTQHYPNQAYPSPMGFGMPTLDSYRPAPYTPSPTMGIGNLPYSPTIGDVDALAWESANDGKPSSVTPIPLPGSGTDYIDEGLMPIPIPAGEAMPLQSNDSIYSQMERDTDPFNPNNRLVADVGIQNVTNTMLPGARALSQVLGQHYAKINEQRAKNFREGVHVDYTIPDFAASSEELPGGLLPFNFDLGKLVPSVGGLVKSGYEQVRDTLFSPAEGAEFGVRPIMDKEGLGAMITFGSNEEQVRPSTVKDTPIGWPKTEPTWKIRGEDFLKGNTVADIIARNEAEAAQQAAIEQQMEAERAERSRQVQRAAAQAQVAQVEQAAQRASTPAGAQDIRSQVDTFTAMPVAPPVVSTPQRKPPPRRTPKKTTKITRPVSRPERKAHVPDYVWVGGLNGGMVDRNSPSMGGVAGPDRWGGGPGDFRGGLASGEGAYGMNPNY